MADFFQTLFDLLRDPYNGLIGLIAKYDTFIYVILFLIVFAETGLVFAPLLPGDSLLFAAGAIAAADNAPLNITTLIILLFCAVFLGDNTNYFVGKFLGGKVYERNYKFFKREYLDRTNQFYEKHGGKTVIMARFVPIVRTFAPFVAGVGAMKYPRFIFNSILGSILWINVCLWAGYFFGNIPWVKANFEKVVLLIIFVSILPIIIGFVKAKFKKEDA